MGWFKNNLFLQRVLLTLLINFWVSIQLFAKELIWNFPLPRTHTGMLVGNVTQGLMIWGEGNQLNITIGHQGFWDHQDGNDVLSNLTFSELRKLLYSSDEEGLEAAFANEEENKALS